MASSPSPLALRVVRGSDLMTAARSTLLYVDAAAAESARRFRSARDPADTGTSLARMMEHTVERSVQGLRPIANHEIDTSEKTQEDVVSEVVACLNLDEDTSLPDS